jgi:uncharacterized phage-associated protein
MKGADNMRAADYTARQIADNLIKLASDSGIEITNLKLQKLLYYAQAWNLVLHDKMLFSENLEAWVHGPVVARVFGDFKEYRWKPIDCVGEHPEEESVREHLSEVLNVYGGYTATQLERLTHQEPPWREARGSLAPDEPSRNVIPLKTMKDYYSSLL